jgi:hypothetical protein
MIRYYNPIRQIAGCPYAYALPATSGRPIDSELFMDVFRYSDVLRVGAKHTYIWSSNLAKQLSIATESP